MKDEKVVMNGAGIEEIGFPMWPQFAPETYEDVLEGCTALLQYLQQ